MSTRKFSVPSTGTILGFIAVLISLGGVAYAAGALVTIGDPITTQKARVAAPGRLGVYIDTPVTTRTASPATSFHVFTTVTAANGCAPIIAAASGKALVVRQVRTNIQFNPAPGSGQEFYLFTNANCSGEVTSIFTAPTLGFHTIPFDPGLYIPQGGTLAVIVAGQIQVNLGVDGYTLPAAQVTSGIAELAAE